MRHYLDLNLNELVDLNKKIRHGLVTNSVSPEHQLFCQIYEDFLLGNTEKLSAYAESVSASRCSGLKNNYQLKLAIRKSEYTTVDLAFYKNCIQSESDPYFKAEMEFALARIYENLENWSAAAKEYESSSVQFQNLNCHFKAQKCSLNSLCSLYNIHQDYQLVYKYEILLQQTIEIQNWDTAAMVANNISRIYLARNANQTALKFNEQALQYSPHTTLLSQHLIKLHQIKINIAMGNLGSVNQMVEELNLSPFPQVVNSLKLLMQYQTTVIPAELPESDRVSLSKDYKLSKSEGQIYDLLLAKQKVSLNEAIDLLFGQKIDHDSAMNRLGNLLFRVRKKTNLRIEIKDQEIVLIK